jgi:hypothetical protein
MRASWIVGLLLTLAVAQKAAAQGPAWHFRWQKGQTLAYQVKHTTLVAEVVDGNKAESESNLQLVKRWQVLDVDAQGIATLQLSLASMRTEQKRPNGETLLFDSQELDKSTPELKEQMAKFVGPPLALLRVDAYGNTVDVKQGSLARYQAEPPFALIFPKATAREGQSWKRNYTVVIEPPLGTGEKYEAEQHYQCTQLTADTATVAVKTEFKTPTDSPQERLPLLQKDVAGTIVFDLSAGCLQAVRLTTDRTIDQHQGPRSRYHFQSRYSEERIASE